MRSRAARFLRQGHRALRSGRLEAAVAAFEKAVEAAPDSRPTLIQLALAQARRGDCEAACATTEAMVELFPNDGVARFFAGRCRLECNEPSSAEPLLRSAAKLQPENVLIQQYLALCEVMKGEAVAAAARLERVGHLANTDLLALFSYEVERRLAPIPPVTDKEQPSPSEQSVAAIARIEERMARGVCRSLFGQIRCRRAARKLVRFGERAYDGGDFAAALAAFEAADRAGSNATTATLGAGLAALRLDQPNQATQLLAKAYARWPDDGIVASSYADALYRSGQFAEALAVFETIEPAGPEDFHTHYGQGTCLAVLGHKRPALEQFRVAFEQYRLDTIDDCLMPSWRELLRRETDKRGEPSGACRAACDSAPQTHR